MSQPAEIIVMTWYRREDWSQLLALFADAERLPADYDQWLEKADAQRREYEKKGVVVEKVYIDPQTFPNWCKKRGVKIDAEARTQYANEFVTVKYMFSSSH